MNKKLIEETITDLEKQIKSFQAQIDQLKEKLKVETNQESIIDYPGFNEEYWSIFQGDCYRLFVDNVINYDDSRDKNLFEEFNFFSTKAEAENYFLFERANRAAYHIIKKINSENKLSISQMMPLLFNSSDTEFKFKSEMQKLGLLDVFIKGIIHE